MTSSRDAGVLVVGMLLGAVIAYFGRNAISGVLKGAGSSPALYARSFYARPVARRYV